MHAFDMPSSRLRPSAVRAGLAVTWLLLALGCGSDGDHEPASPPASPTTTISQLQACDVEAITRDPAGLAVWSPDGQFVVRNAKDAAGISQFYIGRVGSSMLTCLTCTQVPGGPDPARHKMQPQWHPSGRWIFAAVERDTYTPPPVLGSMPDYVEGQLQNGIWTNMWVVSPDGQRWVRLTDFQSDRPGVPDGYTGPAITPDGTTLVWSQIVDGNVLAYWPVGRWELTAATFADVTGTPRLTTLRNITPSGMYWNEPGNIDPTDGVTLVLSGSFGPDAQEQDQYLLNIATGALTNLTRSPLIWDEHGMFSPDGRKIVFMSSYPFRSDAWRHNFLLLATEFMLMNADGSELRQLTHFNDAGYPESNTPGRGSVAANGHWAPDGRSLSVLNLFFPRFEAWTITFKGPCGAS